MRKKLNEILIIDDMESDVYLTSYQIKKAGVTNNIKSFYNAREALDYLSTKGQKGYPQPDVIFLDINMPGMTGWDFLDEYISLKDEMKGEVVVCMLTTSRSQRDQDKAAEYTSVNEFTSKPLTQEKLMSIIEKYFSDLL